MLKTNSFCRLLKIVTDNTYCGAHVRKFAYLSRKKSCLPGASVFGESYVFAHGSAAATEEAVEDKDTNISLLCEYDKRANDGREPAHRQSC